MSLDFTSVLSLLKKTAEASKATAHQWHELLWDVMYIQAAGTTWQPAGFWLRPGSIRIWMFDLCSVNQDITHYFVSEHVFLPLTKHLYCATDTFYLCCFKWAWNKLIWWKLQVWKLVWFWMHFAWRHPDRAFLCVPTPLTLNISAIVDDGNITSLLLLEQLRLVLCHGGSRLAGSCHIL